MLKPLDKSRDSTEFKVRNWRKLDLPNAITCDNNKVVFIAELHLATDNIKWTFKGRQTHKLNSSIADNIFLCNFKEESDLESLQR